MIHTPVNNFNRQSPSESNDAITRRTFIANLTKAAFYLSCIPLNSSLSSCTRTTDCGGKSVISLAQSNNVWSNGKLVKDEIKIMLDKGIASLTGYSDTTRAWNSIFYPKDVIAMKVNTIGRNTGSTKPELTYALAECLNDHVAIPFDNIIIYDRIAEELTEAGYTMNQQGSGIKVLATYSLAFSKKVKQGETEVSLTDIIARQCTAIINLALLKTHPTAGIALSFKNHYGSIPKDIVRDDTLGYHSHNFKNLVYLNATSPIRDKTRLNIIDSLVGQYNLGPHGDPRFQWECNSLIMGIDPVAVDTIGLDIINGKRLENQLPPLKIPYLRWAEEEGLGRTEPSCIEVRQLHI